jgi:DNA polymerase III epsilon subunit-like protein
MKMFAVFDLETTGLDANFGRLLCGVVKTPDEVKIFRIDDKPYKAKLPSDDSKLAAALVAELNQYTILIAHNGVRFDRPFLNTRAMDYGQKMLNPRGLIIDPVKLARASLRLSSNSLKTITEFLCTTQKSAVAGPIWARAAMDRDRESIDYIVDHCVADVEALYEVAEKMQDLIPKISSWGAA